MIPENVLKAALDVGMMAAFFVQAMGFLLVAIMALKYERRALFYLTGSAFFACVVLAASAFQGTLKLEPAAMFLMVLYAGIISLVSRNVAGIEQALLTAAAGGKKPALLQTIPELISTAWRGRHGNGRATAI